MVTKIEKRDGALVDYNVAKIYDAIGKAIEDIGYNKTANEFTSSISRIEDYLNSIEKNGVVTVEEVQDAIISELTLNDMELAVAFSDFRKERSRIRDSKSALMKAISEITFADSGDSDIKRENANVDGNTSMGTMLQYGSAISKEFCRANLLNPKHAKLHDEGKIHIHDMDFMNMGTLTCCQIDLEQLFKGGFSTGHGYLREPQDIMSYAALAAIAIQANQNDQHKLDHCAGV